MLGIVVPVGPKEDTWRDLLKSYEAPFKLYLAIGKRSESEFLSELKKYSNISYSIISSEPGRANQQNAASKLVEEDYILFMHSDSVFNTNNFSKALEVVSNNENVIWYHDLYFTTSNILMRVTELGVKFRCFLLKLPFGDQGIVLSKKLFLKIGGFPNAKIGEDLLFIRNAQKLGLKIKSLNLEIGTSARKYTGKWFKTTFNHLYWTFRLFFRGN